MVVKQLRAITLSGRYFKTKDFNLIKDTINLGPNLSRTELAKTISENLAWYQSNGEPKYQACMKVLKKLEEWDIWTRYLEKPCLILSVL